MAGILGIRKILLIDAHAVCSHPYMITLQMSYNFQSCHWLKILASFHKLKENPQISLRQLVPRLRASLTCESEAFLLPVLAVVDSCSDDLLDEILRVCALDRLGILSSSVRHVGQVLKVKGQNLFARKFMACAIIIHMKLIRALSMIRDMSKFNYAIIGLASL